MLMVNRGFVPAANLNYRYGFNGKENDLETVGTGQGTQDYGARIYNPSLGKFFSVDPLFKSYPWNSCYAFAENTPIAFIDLDGQEKYHYSKTIENGETVFKLIGVEDLVETTYSIEWSGWMPKIVYTTHTNERKEFITHQESEGTVENFDKVQFVTIDETTTYSSVDNMVNDVDGDSGNEKMWHYAAKGLQNIHEEKMMAGNGGGGLNWSKAFKRFGIKDYIPDSKKFMSSANKIVDKSGLTKIGRDLQSHIMRSSGSAFKNIKWSGKSGNADALKVLDNIMSSKNQIIKAAKRGGYEVYDEVSGQGFGISRNGEFNGFRELTKKK